MKPIDMLYKSFSLQNKYKDMNEEKILKLLYKEDRGSVEVVISRIINESVLEHMSLNIDSTLMQMFELNEYLSKTVINNFSILMYNYLLVQLEKREVQEVDEDVEEQLLQLVKTVDIKTYLEKLIDSACEICGLN